MPGIGGRFGTKLPPPAAITTTGAMISVPASVVSFQLPSGLLQRRRHLAEMELGLERLDLFQQPVGQLLAGDDGQAGNVVDRLFRIKLGALAARPVENVDQMRLQIERAELEHREKPDRASSDNNDIGGSATCRHRLLVPA